MTRLRGLRERNWCFSRFSVVVHQLYKRNYHSQVFSDKASLKKMLGSQRSIQYTHSSHLGLLLLPGLGNLSSFFSLFFPLPYRVVTQLNLYFFPHSHDNILANLSPFNFLFYFKLISRSGPAWAIQPFHLLFGLFSIIIAGKTLHFFVKRIYGPPRKDPWAKSLAVGSSWERELSAQLRPPQILPLSSGGGMVKTHPQYNRLIPSLPDKNL